jgi:hypothetical protein
VRRGSSRVQSRFSGQIGGDNRVKSTLIQKSFPTLFLSYAGCDMSNE